MVFWEFLTSWCLAWLPIYYDADAIYEHKKDKQTNVNTHQFLALECDRTSNLPLAVLVSYAVRRSFL